jgi:hypothetical protein
MAAVPRERLGVASGQFLLTRTLGQTMGIALMGALWQERRRRAGQSAPCGS